MASFVIECPTCGKPIIVSPEVSSFPCPYCDKEVDAKKRRNEMLASKINERKDDIRKQIGECNYDEARDACLDAASISEAKAVFLALALECDLLRHHPFFFDHQAIDADVDSLLCAKDFSELTEEELEKTRASCLRALEQFHEKALDCLSRHGAFVGERYDAISRFVYVGMCSVSLKKIGVKTESVAKECLKVLSKLCSGAYGDVYNMPIEAFREAEHAVEAISEEFRFASSIRLQSNPHVTSTPIKKKSICPICGEALPKIDKAQFVTCPTCRHRVSMEAIQNLSLCTEPISYQDKLERFVAENDLQGAEEVLRFLRGRDSANPNYALAELIVLRDGITPLQLNVDEYPKLLRLASSAEDKAFEEQARKTAEHFQTIRSILSEASSLPHGPSEELMESLDQFLSRFA